MPFMVILVISAVLTVRYVKETKNKTYEEIAQIYYSKGTNEPDEVRQTHPQALYSPVVHVCANSE